MPDYEEVPYPSLALRHAMPDQLAVAAVLKGRQPPRPSSARVLEIGCSDAGNLISLAVRYPGASFTGIDLSASAVGRARRWIANLGLANIEVFHADLSDFRAERGGFDYVVAHGVYSWVGRTAANALLESVAFHLAPTGVGFVSYNTYPGSHLRSMVGQAVRRLIGDLPADRQAAAARDWLAMLAGSSVDTSHARILREIAAEAAAKADQLLLHDDLAEVNEPVFFTDFVSHAGSAGLGYLGEAEFAASAPPQATPELLGRLAAMSEVDRQQAMDVLGNRSFRQTLLVHLDNTPADHAVDPARLTNLWVSATARGLSAGSGLSKFELLGGVTATTDDAPLARALRQLGMAWPGCVRAGALDCDLAALFRLYEGRGVQLWHDPIPAVIPGDRPLVSALVRAQAAAGQPMTNLRMESLRAEDRAVATAIGLCDGQHTRARIARVVARQVAMPSQGEVAAELDRLVDRLAASSLFLG